MTQQWLDVGSNWSSDQHRTEHSSLSFQYRVVCQEHYYGTGCRKWCSPRDDKFGHYSCDAQGEIVCQPGWKDPDMYCNTRKYFLY